MSNEPQPQGSEQEIGHGLSKRMIFLKDNEQPPAKDDTTAFTHDAIPEEFEAAPRSEPDDQIHYAKVGHLRYPAPATDDKHPMQPVTNCGRCRDTKRVNGKPCPDCAVPRSEQEWTSQSLARIIGTIGYNGTANAHNAALASVHASCKEIVQTAHAECSAALAAAIKAAVQRTLSNCEGQLAAEREKHAETKRQLGMVVDWRDQLAATKQQLLAAQAAIAELQKTIEGEKVSFNLHTQIRDCLNIDLSALDKHDAEREGAAIKRLSDALTGGNTSTWDEIFYAAENVAEVRKPLVDALERLRDCDFVITLPDRMDAVRKIAADALSKVKERK